MSEIDNSTYQQLVRFCSFQERCTAEVKQKCIRLEIEDTEVESYLEQLKEDGYLNDVRFAKLFVSGKFRIKNWGRIKIRSKLFEKQIERHIIDEALDEIESSDYMQTIKKLIMKRNDHSLKQDDQDKVIRFLASRGFEFDQIRLCINEISHDEGGKNF